MHPYVAYGYLSTRPWPQQACFKLLPFGRAGIRRRNIFQSNQTFWDSVSRLLSGKLDSWSSLESDHSMDDATNLLEQTWLYFSTINSLNNSINVADLGIVGIARLSGFAFTAFLPSLHLAECSTSYCWAMCLCCTRTTSRSFPTHTLSSEPYNQKAQCICFCNKSATIHLVHSVFWHQPLWYSSTVRADVCQTELSPEHVWHDQCPGLIFKMHADWGISDSNGK